MPKIMDDLSIEHRDHAMLLDILEQQVTQLEGGGSPEYDLLRDIIEYFMTYPDHVHHPKEELVLDRLLARDPSLAEALAPVREDHAASKGRIEAFSDVVENALGSGVVSKEKICEQAREFMAAQRAHISLEEGTFFPAARDKLTDEDWDAIAEEAAKGPAPVFLEQVQDQYEELRHAIVDYAGG